MEYQVEQTEQNSDTNLTPETRFAYAVYLLVLNSGVMTEHGALLPEGLNMPKLSRQAEISLNFALKQGATLRRQGFIKNRKDDGRIVVSVTELENYLTENGVILD